jgi:hypothetical protein
VRRKQIREITDPDKRQEVEEFFRLTMRRRTEQGADGGWDLP